MLHPPVAATAWSVRERRLGVGLATLACLNLLIVLWSQTAPPKSVTEAAPWISTAKYIDLTHVIEPGMPLWPAFANPKVAAATAGNAEPGLVAEGEEFTYAKQGFVATSYQLSTDQMGTQLDPPAHWNEYGATISDLPPTFALRPLVVVDVSAKVAQDPGYHAGRADIEAWEAIYGRVPAGSVVMIRSDWSKGWADFTANGLPAAWPGVALDALKFLHLERGILVHGHEPLDTDMTPSLEGEAWLMHHNFAQIEGAANLHLLPPTGSLISIGFARLLGGSGGYARLVAICPPEWPHGVSIAEAPGAPLPAQRFPLRRGADGVLRPTEGATPTEYCSDESHSLGCPLPE